MPDSNGWEWLGSSGVRQFVESGTLQSEEINYKLDIAKDVAQARDALLGNDDVWIGRLKAGANKANFVHHVTKRKFFDWIDEHTDVAEAALRMLWASEGSTPERMNRFSDTFPNTVLQGPGTRLTPISFLLMGMGADQFPPFHKNIFNRAYKRTGYPKPSDRTESAWYVHALRFLDKMVTESAGYGLELRHRLDAQSVLYAVEKGDVLIDDQGPQPPIRPQSKKTSPSLSDIARELLFDTSALERILKVLSDKRQIVFQGPPGTGKTFVALKLAEHLAGSEDRVRLVQFHPSYAYEDFVEGYRPALEAGQPSFKLRSGPLRQVAKDAAENPDFTYVLVIDEINRGNLAKVFGELYFLLEYRHRNIRLQYSDEPFSLPKNLLMIATMNTADRSIALVDLALRRRFHFVPFYPDRPPVQGLLRRWIGRNAPEMGWVADVVERANSLLQDRHAAIGPSYFMRPELDEERVRLVWEHSVLPYVEEYLFGAADRLADFDLDALRRATDATAGDDAAG